MLTILEVCVFAPKAKYGSCGDTFMQSPQPSCSFKEFSVLVLNFTYDLLDLRDYNWLLFANVVVYCNLEFKRRYFENPLFSTRGKIF